MEAPLAVNFVDKSNMDFFYAQQIPTDEDNNCTTVYLVGNF